MRIDWGDGTEPSDPVPMTEIWSHEYDEAGEYLVRLTVWNEQDVATEVRAVVRVLTPAAIRALLDIRPGTGYAPLTILADATGSSGTEWTFAWGDGTFDGPSAETARTHTFHDPGYYVVTLTVTRDDLVETAARGIVVELSPSIPVDPAAPLRYESGLIRKQRLNAGIPRDDLPFPYRLTLAHGVWSMQDTIQLHCPTNETGRALENGSALFLGRITHSDASAVLPEEIAAASYTVFRLDDSDPGVRTPVEGHAAVPLAPGDVLFAEFVKDANWPFDETGYNFRCILDDSLDAPFPTAGRNYLVVFTLEPESMPPRILLQYRVHVV